MPRTRLVVLTWLLATAPAAWCQPIYRCEASGAAVSFQDVPCDAGAGQHGGEVDLPPVNSFAPFPALLDRLALNERMRVARADGRSRHGAGSGMRERWHRHHGLDDRQAEWRDPSHRER